jgi:predicted RNase H-like HicB family nuclease
MSDVRYGIVIEKETKERIREAIQIHLEGMREDGDAIPEACTICDCIDV